MLELLQYPGVALGLLGAWCVAQPSPRWRRRGFACWLVSNACLITWTTLVGAWGLLAMYAVYSITSYLGWRNNAEAPARASQGMIGNPDDASVRT